MRTVTFSDRRIARMVNSKFIPVWINRGPGFHNCEFRTEERIRETSREAYSTRNICTFFITPDERVVHYVAGYYSPELFGEVLKFASNLKDKVDRTDDFRAKHQTAARLLREHVSRIQAENGKKSRGTRYGRRNPRNKTTRTHHMIVAMNYWSRVHDELGGRSTLPVFSDVQYKYLAGNGFSEEPKDAKRVRTKITR